MAGSISLIRQSQSANAYLNQSQYNYFNLAFNQNLTERLSFAVNPYFNIATLQGGSSNYNQYYYGVGTNLTYKLTERTSIGANYRFSYVMYTGLQNYGFPTNDVYIFLNYSYPLHYQH